LAFTSISRRLPIEVGGISTIISREAARMSEAAKTDRCWCVDEEAAGARRKWLWM
jgi:hypothetical protein